MINDGVPQGIARDLGFGEEGGDAGMKIPVFCRLSQQRRGRTPLGSPAATSGTLH